MVKILVEYDGVTPGETISHYYSNVIPRIGELISFEIPDPILKLDWSIYKVKKVDYNVNTNNVCCEVEIFVEYYD